jgi:hypothetical protein
LWQYFVQSGAKLPVVGNEAFLTEIWIELTFSNYTYSYCMYSDIRCVHHHKPIYWLQCSLQLKYAVVYRSCELWLGRNNCFWPANSQYPGDINNPS